MPSLPPALPPLRQSQTATSEPAISSKPLLLDSSEQGGAQSLPPASPIWSRLEAPSVIVPHPPVQPDVASSSSLSLRRSSDMPSASDNLDEAPAGNDLDAFSSAFPDLMPCALLNDSASTPPDSPCNASSSSAFQGPQSADVKPAVTHHRPSPPMPRGTAGHDRSSVRRAEALLQATTNLAREEAQARQRQEQQCSASWQAIWWRCQLEWVAPFEIGRRRSVLDREWKQREQLRSLYVAETSRCLFVSHLEPLNRRRLWDQQQSELSELQASEARIRAQVQTHLTETRAILEQNSELEQQVAELQRLLMAETEAKVKAKAEAKAQLEAQVRAQRAQATVHAAATAALIAIAQAHATAEAKAAAEARCKAQAQAQAEKEAALQAKLQSQMQAFSEAANQALSSALCAMAKIHAEAEEEFQKAIEAERHRAKEMQAAAEAEARREAEMIDAERRHGKQLQEAAEAEARRAQMMEEEREKVQRQQAATIQVGVRSEMQHRNQQRQPLNRGRAAVEMLDESDSARAKMPDGPEGRAQLAAEMKPYSPATAVAEATFEVAPQPLDQDHSSPPLRPPSTDPFLAAMLEVEQDTRIMICEQADTAFRRIESMSIQSLKFHKDVLQLWTDYYRIKHRINLFRSVELQQLEEYLVRGFMMHAELQVWRDIELVEEKAFARLMVARIEAVYIRYQFRKIPLPQRVAAMKAIAQSEAMASHHPHQLAAADPYAQSTYSGAQYGRPHSTSSHYSQHSAYPNAYGRASSVSSHYSQAHYAPSESGQSQSSSRRIVQATPDAKAPSAIASGSGSGSKKPSKKKVIVASPDPDPREQHQPYHQGHAGSSWHGQGPSTQHSHLRSMDRPDSAQSHYSQYSQVSQYSHHSQYAHGQQAYHPQGYSRHPDAESYGGQPKACDWHAASHTQPRYPQGHGFHAPAYRGQPPYPPVERQPTQAQYPAYPLEDESPNPRYGHSQDHWAPGIPDYDERYGQSPSSVVRQLDYGSMQSSSSSHSQPSDSRSHSRSHSHSHSHSHSRSHSQPRSHKGKERSDGFESHTEYERDHYYD